MILKIEINDRLYHDINELCQTNNIKVEKYVLDAIMDNFYTLKYGDLNDKMFDAKDTDKEKIEAKNKLIKNISNSEKEKNEKTKIQPKQNAFENEKTNENDDKFVKKIKRTRILKAK